ncbi:hypothetical protein HMPREF0819_0974 [Streptococcus equinus ATCC 9812]|uniref:Uncharacterized protein n=1 Tax=Streptococcus equinus ATCC 9812 TaxID=525379 RepID=E8JPQ1_STREI|nr:hypothetical protein HMPREF0819_0974 [Streptococcus equinus ATCC 9812]
MNTDERLCKIDGVRQIKSPVEILFMSLETEKRVGNFEEIRFLSKTWFFVADLKQLTELFYSHPRTVEQGHKS